MTAAKAPHKAARALLIKHLDMHPGRVVNNDLDPAEVGIVGDTDHAAGGDSYHLGKDQIRKTGHRYSVDESPLDRAGLDNYASAMDIGYFKVTTPRGTFDLRDFSLWLVDRCEDRDPDTKDIREVIYSPDGKVVKRWDRLKKRSSGDNSHLTHTHISEHRDSIGDRLLILVTRWLTHIGLIEEDDDMAGITQKDFDERLLGALKNKEIADRLKVIDGQGTHNQLLGRTDVTMGAALATILARSAGDDLDEAEIARLVLVGLPATELVKAMTDAQAKATADELALRLKV